MPVGLSVEGAVLVDQVRSIDRATRILRNLGSVPDSIVAEVRGKLRTLLGLTFDGSAFGMGTRAQRFAMLVDDGRVEQLFIETPGEFRVSSADHMLSAL